MFSTSVSEGQNFLDDEVAIGAETPVQILVVEDDPKLRHALASALTAAGYEVTCAEDGVEALEHVQTTRFSVIVTEVDLPRMDGAELAHEIVDHDAFVEFVMLSTVRQQPRLLEAYELGNVNNHFWKPLERVDDILRCIARAVERRDLRLKEAHLLTDLRGAREELAFYHSRLERLDRVSSLGHMMSSVARDMEEPLKSLLGYAQYLRARLNRAENEPLSAEQINRVVDYLEEMERGMQRCHGAVAGMMEYTQFRDEPATPVNLQMVLEDAISMIQPSLEALDIDVKLEMAQGLPAVVANGPRLQHALMSVLVNAQQAMGRNGGTLSVSTEPALGANSEVTGVEIRVSDTGPGIPSSVLPHIFDTFFSTRSSGEGLGLGLTIARNIVRDWRGGIDVASVPGEGTIVTVTLAVDTQVGSGGGEETATGLKRFFTGDYGEERKAA